MKIGVFDSGRGGELIAAGVRPLLPDTYEYIVVNDRDNVPYGSRSDHEIVSLTKKAIAPLLSEPCDIIAIACNTATMAGINALRAEYPDILFVGTEPMIKPAASVTRTRKIAVLGTPLTIKSSRYQHLKHAYADDIEIAEPDTSSWAARIEGGASNEIDFSELRMLSQNGYDTVVLACTHYIALKDRLIAELPGMTILEPTAAIARQIERLSLSLAP